MAGTQSGQGWNRNEDEEKQDQQIPTPVSFRRSRRNYDDAATLHLESSKRPRMVDLEKDVNSGAPLTATEFQQILKEGKAKRKRRAEQERLEGLRQIRDSKSRTGMDPLEQFPEVVWDEIANKLNPSDKANLWEVHPFFHDIMASNRIRDILFPQIVNRRTSFIERHFKDERSNSRSDLFELRLVSKSIRDAIDKWFEVDYRSSGMAMLKESTTVGWKRYEYDYFLDPPTAPIEFKMNYDENLYKRMLEMKKPMRIFRRTLEISLSDINEPNVPNDEGERRRYFNLFTDNVTQALQQIGDQIWRLFLNPSNMKHYGLSSVQFYFLFRDWLQLLPNLKYIKIQFIDPSDENEVVKLIYPPLLTKLPLPTLPALEGLDFDAVSGDIMWSVCDAIFSANPHIKMFISDEYRLITGYLSQCQPDLLKLEMCHFGYPDDPQPFDVILPMAPSPNWNLRRIDTFFISDGIPINSFIKFLNKFPSLEVVLLGMDEITFSEEDIDYLQLPNLIHFGFEFEEIEKRKYDSRIHFFFSLQFLLRSRKLESIEWAHLTETSLITLARQIDWYKKTQTEETLDFGGGFMDLNESNLWNAFPRLEHIHVRCKWMDVDEHLRKYRCSKS